MIRRACLDLQPVSKKIKKSKGKPAECRDEDYFQRASQPVIYLYILVVTTSQKENSVFSLSALLLQWLMFLVTLALQQTATYNITTHTWVIH